MLMRFHVYLIPIIISGFYCPGEKSGWRNFYLLCYSGPSDEQKKDEQTFFVSDSSDDNLSLHTIEGSRPRPEEKTNVERDEVKDVESTLMWRQIPSRFGQFGFTFLCSSTKSPSLCCSWSGVAVNQKASRALLY